MAAIPTCSSTVVLVRSSLERRIFRMVSGRGLEIRETDGDGARTFCKDTDPPQPDRHTRFYTGSRLGLGCVEPGCEHEAGSRGPARELVSADFVGGVEKGFCRAMRHGDGCPSRNPHGL